MKKRKFTLYVRSVKSVVGTEKFGRWRYTSGPAVRPGGYRLVPDYKVYSEPKYEITLPEDQKRVAEMVKEMSLKHGFEVEIIDTATKKGHKIKIFPTLVTDSEEKIEGDITREKIESLLAKRSST